MMRCASIAPPDPIPAERSAARAREDSACFSRRGVPPQERVQRVLRDGEVCPLGDAKRARGELIGERSGCRLRGGAQDRQRFEPGARRITDGDVHSRTVASPSDSERGVAASGVRARSIEVSGVPDIPSGKSDALSGGADGRIAVSRFCAGRALASPARDDHPARRSIAMDPARQCVPRRRRAWTAARRASLPALAAGAAGRGEPILCDRSPPRAHI